MSNKIKIALVYSPQKGPPGLTYENEDGIIYSCATPQKDMVNIGMGFYSLPHATSQDSLLAIEPFCVLERDYEYKYIKNYKHIFTWTPAAFGGDTLRNKVVEINHPSCHTLPNPHTMTQNWPAWKDRSNEIVFIANNKMSSHDSELYSLRLKLADMLSQKFKVSWYGQIPIEKPYYRGSVVAKEEILKRVKFSVCMENCYHPIYSHNYFTEKMPEVWFAGAIPIYMGCFNIDDFGFAEHSYIDLRTYCQRTSPHHFKIDFDSLARRIEHFDLPRYENFIDDVRYNMTKENGLFHHISYSRMYEKMIQTVKND